MVIFKRNDAYLLDLLDHDSWTKESLVETAVTDWPGAKLFTVMRGMKLYPPGRPEIARTDLRNSESTHQLSCRWVLFLDRA